MLSGSSVYQGNHGIQYSSSLQTHRDDPVFLLGFPNHIASNKFSSLSSDFIVCSSCLVSCMCNIRLVNIYSKVRSQEQKSPRKYTLIALLKIPSTLNNNLMLVQSSKMIWYCIFSLSSHVGSYSQICLATVVAV